MKFDFSKNITSKNFFDLFEKKCILCNDIQSMRSYYLILEDTLDCWCCECKNCKLNIYYTENSWNANVELIIAYSNWNLRLNYSGATFNKWDNTSATYKKISNESNMDINEIVKMVDKYIVLM